MEAGVPKMVVPGFAEVADSPCHGLASRIRLSIPAPAGRPRTLSAIPSGRVQKVAPRIRQGIEFVLADHVGDVAKAALHPEQVEMESKLAVVR
jgi:hypothetical protein